MSDDPTTLTREEKLKAAAMVDEFLRVIERRHGITIHEIVEAVQYTRERKQAMENTKSWLLKAVLGTTAGGAILALWEGVKELLRRN